MCDGVNIVWVLVAFQVHWVATSLLGTRLAQWNSTAWIPFVWFARRIRLIVQQVHAFVWTLAERDCRVVETVVAIWATTFPHELCTYQFIIGQICTSWSCTLLTWSLKLASCASVNAPVGTLVN